MRYTFNYEPAIVDSNVIACDVSFSMELSAEQEKRLIESFNSGKYYFLDEDENISDIYEMVRDEVVCLEEAGENPEVAQEVTSFTYPEELKKMRRN